MVTIIVINTNATNQGVEMLFSVEEKCKIKIPIKLSGGPGKTGRKLPSMPTIINANPNKTKNTSTLKRSFP